MPIFEPRTSAFRLQHNKKKHMTTSVAATSQNTSDLIRISHSKTACGLCPNSVRNLFAQGLTCYRVGRASFFSRSELENLIKRRVVLEGRPPQRNEKPKASLPAKPEGKAARK